MDSLVSSNISDMVATKNELRQKMQANKQALAIRRLIESTDRRVVHFIFNPKQAYPINHFARKLQALCEGTLEDLETADKEKIDGYLERLQDDSLEDGEVPIQYQDSPFKELGLGNITNLAFATADDPFTKAQVAKYYPEAVVVSGKGEVLARISPEQQTSAKFDGLRYLTGFRDDKLRINDDKKVKIDLTDFSDDAGVMVLLLVRSFDTRAEQVPEGAFA